MPQIGVIKQREALTLKLKFDTFLYAVSAYKDDNLHRYANEYKDYLNQIMDPIIQGTKKRKINNN
jgi:hypothetical protein